MATRLGLDIGTNSIGWCLLDGDSIRDIGVRIFSDGRDPKSGASLAVDRRDARAMRRRRDRYVRRRSALLEALIDTGLMPAGAEEAKLIADGKHEMWRDSKGKFPAALPYDLRDRALDQRLQPYEIGRALFHLNQRRGFKSNRKAERKSGDDKEGGKIAGSRRRWIWRSAIKPMASSSTASPSNVCGCAPKGMAMTFFLPRTPPPGGRIRCDLGSAGRPSSRTADRCHPRPAAAHDFFPAPAESTESRRLHLFQRRAAPAQSASAVSGKGAV